MILTQTLWQLRELTREIWIRVALLSALAIVAAALTPVLGPLVPDAVRFGIDETAAQALLEILTNSMLVVATFSLTVMVTAHNFAASQASPRAHRLLRQDGRTQSILATFIGAFVFALFSRIVISVGLYGDGGFSIIYLVTIFVIGLVIVALIRWVQQLSELGSMEATTGRIEEAAHHAMKTRMDSPYLGCTRLPEDAELTGQEIFSTKSGYVQHIDANALSEAADASGGRVDLVVLPGDWVAKGDLLMRVSGLPVVTDVPTTGDDSAEYTDLRENVLIDDLQSFDQDPLFGLQVMSEIAQRALSPSLNDPRTAIDVMHRQSRLLALWPAPSDPVPDDARTPLPGVRAREISAEAAISTAFDAIARDGAGMVEVQMALQRVLARLAEHGDPEMAKAARTASARAIKLSDAGLSLEQDRVRVREIAPKA